MEKKLEQGPAQTIGDVLAIALDEFRSAVAVSDSEEESTDDSDEWDC